ncbi:Candidapepsin-2 [Cytospora mali]|uniref:Candidapepsin-2 n=1 Tax=Cytospora mali TaxID=578113 RepID=A0A194WE60_CYTMA|nr:Candidapepsin-2 [Valsa mali]
MSPRLPTLLALALPVINAASTLPPREISSIADSIENPGFISFPIHRGTKSLSARDATASLVNDDDTSYLIELAFGSNAQSVKVAIDTGSDELFVNPNCNDRDFSSAIQKACTADGEYEPNESTTANVTTQTSEIVYGSGAVEIQYVVDSVGIPGTSTNMSNVQFGMAINSEDLNEGILGLGFGEGVNLNYSNFVDQLAAQKVTNTKAFSVALGTSDTAGGSVIFGGVDTKKFSGSLASNAIQDPVSGDIQRYSVQMNSITFKNDSATTKYADTDVSVVLDTGSSLCELPTSIVSAMATSFGAQEDSSGLLYVDCSYQSSDGSLDFAFPGVTISVPFSDFILSDGRECVLGVQAFDSDSGITALLGDSFLRSAYVVFDQTNMLISMAQYVNCGTNEQAIPAGTGGVSGFTGECSSNSTSSSSSKSKSAGDVTRPAAAASIVGLVAGLAALVALV